MSFQLVSITGDQRFELRATRTLVLGRALSCDLPVVDPTISRRHAELRAGEECVHVADLGSSNGTFVNGERVQDAELRPGDSVTFGKVTFELHQRAVEETTDARDPAAPQMGETILRERPVLPQREALARALRRSGPQETVTTDTAPVSTIESRDQRTLELLLEVAKGLSRAREPDLLLREIIEIVFEILSVDRASVLLVDDTAEEKGALVPRVARDRNGRALEGAVPSTIARRAVDERVAILSGDAPQDSRFGGQSIIRQQVRSAICAPLLGSEGRVLGVLYVDNLTLSHHFTEHDLGVAIAFAGIAGVALENSQLAERVKHDALVRSTFERYFAPALAERIASAPDAGRLGGEKRTVAVLFSDIRGFTKLAEGMTPDDVARLLTEYFTQMVECVFRHGGTLDKFMGDAVLAQWGAPISSPDDADRALRAAIDMMHELETLNERWRAEGRPTLQIGIGISHGEVFVGNIGSERRLEYTVIGDAVNVASGLCSCARRGEILISDSFREALHDAPPLEAHEPLELKGKLREVTVHRVVL